MVAQILGGAASVYRLHSALDRCDQLLRPGNVAEAAGRLVRELALIRRSATPDQWRAAVAGNRDHPVHARLALDPYIRDASRKPRGYAGDAATLDYVYERQHRGDLTALGSELFEVSTGVPIAEAVRLRCSHIAVTISAMLEARPQARILSIACGHMRELRQVPRERLEKAQLFGLDHDEKTIESLGRLHGDLPLQPLKASVRDIIKSRVALPEADLIYTSGLYDYLDEPVASMLTRILLTKLRPGGALLIVNLTPANEEIAFMEAVMDWWMVYRSESHLAALARGVIVDRAEIQQQTFSLIAGRVAGVLIRLPSSSWNGTHSGEIKPAA